jgi:hypothetical protein
MSEVAGVRARTVRRVLTVGVLAMAMVAVGLGVAPDATSQVSFAPADQATIHPGVQLFIKGSQCTANFIYLQGGEEFIGMAAHCASRGEPTNLDGCANQSLPLGTPVEIDGATRPGTLAYSSWETMQRLGERDALVCGVNDFAFVRIDPADHGRVNPTVPHWGGPLGVAASDVPVGVQYRAYGNSLLRQGLTLLSPMGGLNTGTYAGGWVHRALTLLPGVPGDSGMGLQTTDGLAVGVLSSLIVLPDTGQLNFTDVGLAMQYARQHGFPGLTLATGDHFDGNQFMLDL